MKGLPVRGEPDGHAADSAFGQLHRPLARLLCRLVDQPPQGMAGFERLDGRVGGAIGGGDGLAQLGKVGAFLGLQGGGSQRGLRGQLTGQIPGQTQLHGRVASASLNR